jgi:excinuclease UvrABC nuclease subunit
VLSERVEFDRDRDSELLLAIPAAPAVFLLHLNQPAGEPYVGKTSNLRRRLQRLLGAPTGLTKKLNLRNRVNAIEYRPVGSDFESGFLVYQLLHSIFPKTYSQRLRLRFAPVIKLHLGNHYPRASVTTRVGQLNRGNSYYGPFPSRVAAEKFVNDSLDFFKMRRCVEDLHPDPAFPGCIYSEMKMCLAPCFKGCTDNEYKSEVGRVVQYFDSSGESLVREISAQRDQASTNLEFETAATLHARFERVKSVLAQVPEIVRRIDQLDAIIVQRSTIADSVALFSVDRGSISGPLAFSVQSPEHTKSQSMEARLKEALAQLPSVQSKSAMELMEHLAILKRWYYRGHRMGEIFFADEKGALPIRRLVRGIGRVYLGEKPETDSGIPTAPALNP